MTDSIISVRNLVKTYGAGLAKKGFRAIDDVCIDVGRGSVFGLLGPNGAGKTTLIKVLLGLVRGWKGEATLFDQRAGDPVPRRRVGYLPEAHRLPPYLTGRQVLQLYGMYSRRDADWLKERIPPLIDRVGMTAAADRKIRTYSKGMQQRIGLAQALVHEPELVFLDEPTDGIDPNGRAVIREMVGEMREKGTTVFINSHLLMEVEMICDRVVIMDKGKIVREGSVEELTPKTGLVRFEIDPIPHNLADLLRDIGQPKLGPNGFEIALDDETNQIIDRLRANNISIRAVEPRKLTLEEAFIEVVQEVSQ